jgi:hypothetical protein
MKIKFFAIFLLILIISGLSYTIFSNNNIPSLQINENEKVLKNDTNNIIITPTTMITTEPELVLPSNDFALNNINWQTYPNMQNPRIITSKIAQPNDVIDHKFIFIQLDTDVTNTRNKTEIFKQLEGICMECVKIYGENSGLSIYGNVGGIGYFHVERLPYGEKIFYDGWNYDPW